MAEGIEVRVGTDGSKSYRASVWSTRDRKPIRKTFPSLAEAKTWRADATVAVGRGTMRVPTQITVRDAFKSFLDGARSGAVRNRSGDHYKPSAIRGYADAFRLRIEAQLGARRLSEVRHRDVQDLVDSWIAEGLSPASIDSALTALRAVYRRAVNRGDVAINPTTGIEKPAVRGGPYRIADADEAEQLIQALPAADRPTWATAMYAGLRRGELMALAPEHVDLGTGVIRVERAWDEKEGLIGLKSRAGKRKVPIAAILRDYLDATNVRPGLAFGRDDGRPFNSKSLSDRADKAWQRAGLHRITLHECRHTFASLMIAANVNAKALSTFMGHANISITLDLYGHLMPGSEAQAAELLDAYLQEQNARAADPMGKRWEKDPSIQRAETG
jgi:integrase